MTRVSGIVLAAGAGRRMGAPKADLIVDGRRLVDRAVAALRDGGCDEVVAVIRAGTAASTADRDVVNPEPDRGLRSSLALGVAAADHDGIAVLLVDTPGIGAAAVRAVLAHWSREPERIAVACFDGRRGHPIVMTAPRWKQATALADDDEGARRYLAAHADRVDEVAAPGDASDLDHPGELRAWRARSAGGGGEGDGPAGATGGGGGGDGSGEVRTGPAR